jgi:hypothetical protein
MTRCGSLAAAAVLAGACAIPAVGHAHLFHAISEPPENQLTRDYATLVRLVDFPHERFDLAREVYGGRERVRVKPGGFRSWLRRPAEPGMVFKAEAQLSRWTGTLEGECRRLDARLGTDLDGRVRAALDRRAAPELTHTFREVFAYLVVDLLGAAERQLTAAEASRTTLAFASRYVALAHEAWLNVNDRPRALMVRATLEALDRSVGDADRGVPPSPETFAQQRARLVRLLGRALAIDLGRAG